MEGPRKGVTGDLTSWPANSLSVGNKCVGKCIIQLSWPTIVAVYSDCNNIVILFQQ